MRATWALGLLAAIAGGAAVAGGVVTDAVATIPPFIACQGDCDGSGAVGVNELVTGVNIALNLAAVEDCPPFDARQADADGRIARTSWSG